MNYSTIRLSSVASSALFPLVLLLWGCATTSSSGPAAQAKMEQEAREIDHQAQSTTQKASDIADEASANVKATEVETSAGKLLGDPLPADVHPMEVSQLVSSPEEYDGRRIAVKGIVTKMCKKKGCWFEMTDGHGGAGVLVTSSRHHIFLSQGSEGKEIVAFGTFKVETQDLEEARHLARDAGEPEPEEAPEILRLVADGALIR